MGVSGTALADPTADAFQKLTAIGKRAQPKSTTPVATCMVPTKSEAADLKKRTVAWIDQQFPDERQAEKSEIEGMELVFSAGCKDGKATFVSVGQDRKLKKADHPLRRNFILRITGDTIEQVAARTSTFSPYWMEWADEGSYSVLGMLDLDGDGASDLVWSDNEQEGGSRSTWSNVSVRFATGKAAASFVRVANLFEVSVSGSQLVVAGKASEYTRPIHACVGKDLRVASCAAAAPLQRASDKTDAANQLADLTEMPDHDLAVSWLGAIGVKAPADVIAALPATTPIEKAQRHVEAFLEAKQLDETFQGVFSQPHPEATAYFTQLAAQLGDKACTPTPLTDATRAKLTTWIGKQDKQPEQIELSPECGTYAWAAWNRKGDPDRTESLVAVDGSEPVRIAKFPIVFEQGPVVDHHLTSQFFQHGDTVLGVVIRNSNLAVIANNKIIAQSHGNIVRYDYDRRWAEHSFDVVVDSGSFIHPTPTGLEKLDRDAVKDHETQRLAIEHLLDNPASNDASYLAALRTLGADAKLVAECKALVAPTVEH
jgi:hypothetical protein